MTYTILLNGGREVEIEHDALPAQMEAVIKGYQTSGLWVKFITTGDDVIIDSNAIQGYIAQGAAGVADFNAPGSGATPAPKKGRPPKKP